MSIATQIEALQTDKTNIANAIAAKGGTVASGDGFDDFATDIATIPSGGNLKDISPVTKNGTYAVYDDLEIYDSMTLTGNAYCNTDFTPDDYQTDSIEASFIVTSLASGATRNRLFGTVGSISGSSNYYTLAQISNGFYLIASNGINYTVALTPVVGTEYVCTFDGNTFSINGVTATTTTESGCADPYTLDLFASNTGSSHTNMFTGTFKYLKIGSNMWFVPSKLNGEPAVCNKITGKTYTITGSGVTLGNKVSTENYDGFESPLTVSVENLYHGASGEDLFPNTTTNHTITLPSTTPSAYLYDKMFARYRGGYSDVIFTGTAISANAFQYFAYYGHIKSFTADNITRFRTGHEFYYAFEYSTIEKISFKNLATIVGTYGFYYTCHQSSASTDLKEIDFSSLQSINNGANAFCYAFMYCTGIYPNKVAHPFPALTTVTGSNTTIFGYIFRYGKATMYVFDKLTSIATAASGASEFIYAFANHTWDYRSGDSDGRKCGAAFPLVTVVGVSGGTAIYANCKYLMTSPTNNCALYMTSLTTIYNENATNSNGQFAYCNADYIYMPKLTSMTTKPEYVFYGSTGTQELHFGIENQATIEAMTGYSTGFGATSATIYFDLANHITINGTVYDRNGNYDDYDDWYFGFTDGTDTYYIDNYYGVVGDTVYTKSGDTYTATAYTVTAIS